MALGSRFQKLRGGGGAYYQGELKGSSEGQLVAKFLEGARFYRATIFFSKCAISVATLLLIIQITMYILK